MPRIYADFNGTSGLLPDGTARVYLSFRNLNEDLDSLNPALAPGLKVRLYQTDDYDENGRPDSLEVDGVMGYDSNTKRWFADFIWNNVDYMSAKNRRPRLVAKLECRTATSDSEFAICSQFEDSLLHSGPEFLLKRLLGFLNKGYTANLFSLEGNDVGYALWVPHENGFELCYLIISTDFHRKGFGRQAFDILRAKFWGNESVVSVKVAGGNAAGIAFFENLSKKDHNLRVGVWSE